MSKLGKFSKPVANSAKKRLAANLKASRKRMRELLAAWLAQDCPAVFRFEGDTHYNLSTIAPAMFKRAMPKRKLVNVD